MVGGAVLTEEYAKRIGADAYAGDAWSVDRVHPNDYGFVSMAKGIEKVLKPLLKNHSSK